jgi:hypothetical protein
MPNRPLLHGRQNLCTAPTPVLARPRLPAAGPASRGPQQDGPLLQLELAVVAGQHDVGGLVQQGPHPPVAAFRDAADVVELPGLIAFWNEARQAPTSRDRRMRDGSSMAATKASAVSSPTPGIVINRRQAAEALVMRLMSASIAAIALMTAVRAAISPRMAAERPATPSLALRA